MLSQLPFSFPTVQMICYHHFVDMEPVLSHFKLFFTHQVDETPHSEFMTADALAGVEAALRHFSPDRLHLETEAL